MNECRMVTLNSSYSVRISCLLLLLHVVSGDYDCLCNYNVELTVYAKPSTKSSHIGYLYEFDCKQLLSVSDVPKGWRVFAYNHQYGYINEGDGIELQICAGTPPDADKVITTVPTQLTTSTRSSYTTSSTTSTVTTTTTQTTTTATTQAPTITTTTTQAPPTTKTSTTTRQPTTTTTSTTTHLPTILTGRPTTPAGNPNLIIGNTSLCPSVLHRYTLEDKGALTQYGDYCYEIVPIRAIWSRAESDCIAKGGDLFHIDSQDLQDYMYRWIKSYNFDHAVWTGLHDVRTEEHFEWISGDHVVYTNFHFDRKGNFASHYNEDCVLFVPYAPYYGKWDDVICGSITVLGDVGQQNPFICEFPIHPQHTLQLIG